MLLGLSPARHSTHHSATRAVAAVALVLLGAACARRHAAQDFVGVVAVTSAPTAGPLDVRLAPGSDLLRAARVAERWDTLVVIVSPPGDSAERVHATLFRHVSTVRLAIGNVLRETQHYGFASGPFSDDTFDVDAKSLAPRRYFSAAAGGMFDVRIDGRRIVGWRTDSTGAKTLVEVAATQPFFASIMTEAFAPAMPFAPGTTFEIPVANPPSPDVHVLPLRVTSIDTLRTARGPVPCLIVVGPAHTTTWISRGDGHVVRMRWTLPNGSTVWKLPERDAALR